MKKLFIVKPNLYLPEDLTIVGSSKILLKNKHGEEIDKSNFIVRFNFATTSGFEDYVGSFTSLMVINNHVYQSLENDKNKFQKVNKYLVISPYTEKKNSYKSEFFFFEKKLNQYFLALKFIRSFDTFIDLIKILRKKNFSVAFCFILLCISSGIKLRIFGFDIEEDMHKREHYYQKQPIGGRHDLASEHIVLKKLKNKQIINIS